MERQIILEEFQATPRCPNCLEFMTSLESKVCMNIFWYCEKCFCYGIQNRESCCKDYKEEWVRFKIRNGRFRLRKRCSNCGVMEARDYKSSIVKNFDSLPILEENENSKLKSKKWEEYNRFMEWIQKKQKEYFFQEHDKYLNTPEWKKLRLLVLKRDNYLCQFCLTNPATQVHHKTYERWKNEAAYDLESVCDECHGVLHSE